MTRIDSNADLVNLQQPDYEIGLTLLNLKQRMSPQQNGKQLVDSVKIERRDKEEINPTISKNSLTGVNKTIADLLPNISMFMEFQVDSWNFINQLYSNKTKEALIVSAPTGFGKTEAVIPTIINHISNTEGIAILIFPRRALLLDQLKRLAGYNFPQGSIRIGMQMDGINGLLEWTIYNEKQKNISIRNFPHIPPQIDPKKHFNYHFETELLSVDYLSGDKDRVKLSFIKCGCGGDLYQDVFFRSVGVTLGLGRRDQHSSFIGSSTNTTWTCENCSRNYSVSISRNEHIVLKPNLIFTTIDSLPSLFSDPEIRDDLIGKPITVVLDEIHVYYGSYGAHAASILSQLASRVGGNITSVGLSATIDKPREFGKKVFGKDTVVISPKQGDKSIIKDAETYYFIKSASDTKKSGEFYSLKSQAMIQFGLLSASSVLNQNKTMLAFMDSIDAVSLLQRQTEDAYNYPSKRLHHFRLDGLTSDNMVYNQQTCSGFNPGTCEVNCTIHEAGECWNILRNSSSVTTPQRISINSVWASALPDRTTLGNSHIIYSTSELELGIDLPHVEQLVQYGAPYTIFNYLQRKGRAGRTPGSKPSFYFILGDKSNDFVYFSHGRNILNRMYMLPLNTENRVVKDIHRMLNETYDESINEYQRITTNQTVQLTYVRKFRSSWYAVLSKISTDFSNFLSNNLGINLQTIVTIADYPGMKDFKRDKGDLIDQFLVTKQNELNDLLMDGQSPLRYLEEEKQKLLDKIEVSTINNNDKVLLKQRIETVIGDVLVDMGTPTAQRNPTAERQHQVDLLQVLYNIGIQYLGSELGEASSEFHAAVHRVATVNQTLVNGQQRIRELFFLVQTMNELGDAVNRSLSSEIIKYVYRAQHFYDLSSQSSAFTITSPLPSPLPPTNLFSTSSREVLVLSGRGADTGEARDIKEVIYKYFPFRLNEVGAPGSKKLVQPRVERNNGSYQFEPREYLDGLLFRAQRQQRQVLLPMSAVTESIQDDGVNGIVSFCDQCLVLQDYSRDYCRECRQPLSKVRAYASPIVEVKVNDMGGISAPIRSMSYGKSTDVMITLNGVELNLRYQRFDQTNGEYMPSSRGETFQINATIPYGYMVNTHSIEIQIPQMKIADLISNFRNLNQNRQITTSDVLHTLAHLWVKTVSLSTGITDEYFAYRVNDNDQSPSIVVSEFQEGGAGYLEIFADLISKSTNSVLDNMHSLTNCAEHNRISTDVVTQQIANEMQNLDFRSTFRLSKKDQLVREISGRLNLQDGEVIDHFPTCYDGCPYCIGLSGCEQGVEEQFDNLSLQVARDYVNSLVITTNDQNKAASLVANGGILVRSGGGQFGIFLL
ncbi:MAG: DEAD/DEAH box helicase [Candidatus Thermoplasmatota archaeon]|nr:DEAD/DEAH box helicase [Candidatus Thermoplasmatota archaeon]MCL6002296.1 DEAD/DEAH box helicase [Candidatus Thermoplasmatota archaeon]